MKNKKLKKPGIWQISMLLLLCLQVLLVIYYGGRKAGYHEDEYYSYYSTNRTAGLFVPDREWVDKDTYRNEFVVLEGERFHYGLVSTVQSWDVHPPLYYLILHTVCSLFPGIFSKWLGISVNLIAFVINFFLLAYLTYKITDQNRKLTFLVNAVHGFNAVVISGVLFIRMYEWLTLFILLCACIHVRAMKKEDYRFRTFLLPVMAVTYLGFLTQYYYVIFIFFLAAGLCILFLVRDRNLWNCLRYGGCLAGSGLLAVLSYPASLSHIFRGYRGAGAASEFLDAGNTESRLEFFYELMDDYVFDGAFLFLLLLIAVLIVMLLVKKKGEVRDHQGSAPFFVLSFAVCGYFFTVSKTALLLYETSNRYQLPIYGILMMLIISALYTLSRRAAEVFSLDEKAKKAGLVLLFVLFLAGDIHELISGKVLFLYEEDAAGIAYAKENADIPVIVLYNDVTPYHVWWCSEELLAYDGVYFASQGNKEKITDAVICSSDKVIVYAADYETKEENLQMILDSSEQLSEYHLVSQKSLWSVYEFNSK